MNLIKSLKKYLSIAGKNDWTWEQALTFLVIKLQKQNKANFEKLQMWTPENRLKLIKALAQMKYENNIRCPESEMDLLQRIMFLCDMPDEFLEINKQNYEDAIKFAQAKLTVS